MNFTVVSCFTEEYEDCVPHIRQRVEDFGLPPAQFVRLETTKDWKRNERLKPTALSQLRFMIRGYLLFFDIDTTLIFKPTFPHHDADIGLIDNPCVTHKNKIACQAMWINDTFGAFRFLYWWDLITRQGSRQSHVHMTQTIRYCMMNEAVMFANETASLQGCWKFNGQRPERKQEDGSRQTSDLQRAPVNGAVLKEVEG